jgi:hypothetical protein
MISVPDSFIRVPDLAKPGKIPYGAVSIDAAHPLGSACRAFFLGNRHGWQPLVPTTQTFGAGASFQGTAIYSNATSYPYKFDSASEDHLWPRTGPFTYFARFKSNGIPASGNERVVIQAGNRGLDNFAGMYVRSNGSAWALRADVHTISYVASNYVFPASEWNNVLLTRDSSGSVRLLGNGMVISSGSSSTADIYNRTGLVGTALLSDYGVTTYRMNGWIECAFIAHEFCPDSMAAAICLDPYQLLRPQ